MVISNMAAPQEYRHRYLVFELNKRKSERDLIRICIKMNREYELIPKVRLILCDENIGKCLVRCDQSQVDLVKRNFGDKTELDADVLGVSGTIRRARIKFFN